MAPLSQPFSKRLAGCWRIARRYRPACVIRTTLSCTEIVPVRADVPVFAATVNETGLSPRRPRARRRDMGEKLCGLMRNSRHRPDRAIPFSVAIGGRPDWPGACTTTRSRAVMMDTPTFIRWFGEISHAPSRLVEEGL